MSNDKQKRKVVQIEISAAPSGCESDHCFASREWEVLFALCNDGSIWRLNWPCHDPNDNEWVRVKDIPQDEE